MRSFNRRFALVLPSLLIPILLAACAVAPGDEGTTESSESAYTIAPIHILPPLEPIFQTPTYYTAQSGQVLKMQSATTSVCLLQSVSGSFTGTSSVGWIYTVSGYYYLSANGGAQVSAACAPLSDFTGTDTSAISSTASSPFWLSAALPQTDLGDNSTSLNLWTSPTSACFFSGFGGDWSGIDTGATQTNWIDVATINGAYTATLDTNGSGNKVWANCYQFPGRSTMTRVGGAQIFEGEGAQSLSLNAKQASSAESVGEPVGLG